MTEELLHKLETDIRELKQDVKGIFKILSKQEALIEGVNSLRQEMNRMYKSHTEIFNRLRELENQKAEKHDIERIDGILEGKVSRKELIVTLMVVGGIFAGLSFILNIIAKVIQ